MRKETRMIVGQIGGQVTAIALRTPYCYIGIGSRLVILDLANPATRAVGVLHPPLADAIRSIAIAGPYVYLATGRAGLYILDIADPAAPRVVGSWRAPTVVRDLAVSADRAFVALGGDGLAILDVRDPTHPVALGPDIPFARSQPVTGNTRGQTHTVDRVAVAGSYACVTAGYSQIAILDVRDPGHVIEAGRYNARSRVSDFALVGNGGYIVADRLHCLDFSIPHAPRSLDLPLAYPAQSFPACLAVVPPYVYLGMIGNATPPGGGAIWWGWTGLWRVDTRRTAPEPATETRTPSGPVPSMPFASGGIPADGRTIPAPVALAADDHYVGAACGAAGVCIAETGASSFGSGATRRYQPPAFTALGVATIHDRYAYTVIDGDPALLTIIDLAATPDPRPIGSCPVPVGSRALAFRDGHLFVAFGWDPAQPALRVYNVRDPTHPTEVAALHLGANAAGLALAGACAYVVGGAAYRALPFVFGTAPPRLLIAAALEQFHREHGRSSEGALLHRVDVFHPTRPRLLSRCLLPGIESAHRSGPVGIAVAGAHGYVVTRDGQFHVFDLRDSHHAYPVGSCAVSEEVTGMAMVDAHAYVATVKQTWDGSITEYASDLQVVDVRDPAQPTVVDALSLPGQARGVSAGDGRLHVATKDAGLQIVQTRR